MTMDSIGLFIFSFIVFFFITLIGFALCIISIGAIIEIDKHVCQYGSETLIYNCETKKLKIYD